MLKKSLISMVILAASTGLALANGGTYTPPAQAQHHHSGEVYIGASIGAEVAGYDTRQNLSSNYNFFVGDDSGPSNGDGPTVNRKLAGNITSHDFVGKGWVGEIFAGYGVTFCDHHYLGIEMSASIDKALLKHNAKEGLSGLFPLDHLPSPFNIISTHTVAQEKTDITLQSSYGISLIPGIKLSKHTLFYGRIGWLRGRFNIKYNALLNTDILISEDIGDDRGASSFKLPLNGTLNRNKNGLQLGVGLETTITDHISIRGEYDYSIYYSNLKLVAKANKTIPVTIGTPDPIFSPSMHNFSFTHTIKIKNPQINQFKLAIIFYRFAI